MLCLNQHAHEDCSHICDIHGKRKKDRRAVFHAPEINEEFVSDVDNVRELFKDHVETMKSKLRVSQDELDQGVGLLQRGEEPQTGCCGNVAKAFWHARALKKTLLTSEMDLRGTSESFGVKIIPSKLSDWNSHTAVIGPSGSGKTWWICSQILDHWKSSTRYNRRRVYYLSSEVFLDKTLHRISDVRKFEDLYYPVDISVKAGEVSGLSPSQFWDEMVRPKIDDVRDSVICWDDSMDSYCPQQCRKTIDRMCRTARHDNNMCFVIFHSIRSGVWTRQILQSAKFLVLFPRAQRGKVRNFFNENLSLTMPEARSLVDHLQTCGRSCVVRLHNPVCVIAEKYLRLI